MNRPMFIMVASPAPFSKSSFNFATWIASPLYERIAHHNQRYESSEHHQAPAVAEI
ncbi:hypothetical protein [Paraburkholderia sp. SG-MS1]|uniref:hypothetical protein n=1 Tax=Paraburkholderia sp. SG-MS1 TaxID=2023741 RepID=UPI0014457A65|nr:hypothetical protein [Paraburkholderia sp. SG-MS1]